jgi:hypothetical protein
VDIDDVTDRVDADRLRELEARRLRSLVEGDMPTAEALHAAEYQLINPFGTPLTRQEYLGAIATGQLDYRVFEAMSEVAVLVGSDLGCLRYQANIDIRSSTGDSDSGAFWHTDVYQRRGGDWSAIWSQATRITS